MEGVLDGETHRNVFREEIIFPIRASQVFETHRNQSWDFGGT
jgi:hypothetical protein